MNPIRAVVIDKVYNGLEQEVENDYAYNTQFLKQKVYSGINSNDINQKQNIIDFKAQIMYNDIIEYYGYF